MSADSPIAIYSNLDPVVETPDGSSMSPEGMRL